MTLAAACSLTPSQPPSRPQPTTPTGSGTPVDVRPLFSLTARAVDSVPTSCRPPADAVASEYRKQWRGGNRCRQFDRFEPTYLALDLGSAVVGPALVAWYDDATGNYDTSTGLGGGGYDEPRTYLLEATRGSSEPPTSGWVALGSAAGETLHSRVFAVDLAGYRWLRFSVTAVNGSEWNYDAGMHVDVAADTKDAVMFFGDSITADDMTHSEDFAQGIAGSYPNFAQLVSTALPAVFPIYEDGGVAGLTAATHGPATFGAEEYVPAWLKRVPERYVVLAYGTNDANQGVPPAAYLAAMRAMVRAVEAAGKVPVIPTIPWNCIAPDRVQRLNQEVAALWTLPGVLAGPDLYRRFDADHSLIGKDCIHPTIPTGAQAYREAWATWAVGRLYGGRRTG